MSSIRAIARCFSGKIRHMFRRLKETQSREFPACIVPALRIYRQGHHSGNLIPALRTVDVLLPGEFEELLAQLVEGAQYRPLVTASVGLQIS